MSQLATGNATPLGATYDGSGVNFTLFSAHAGRVELCVFDAQGNEQRYDLPARSGISGTAIYPARVPVCATAIACMVRGRPRRGIFLIRRSC